ncbi:MAG TPA: 16S rRNA (guanine(966)-N(2))-methyltransferase RsmD [Gammaproteobacteria bacterium]|nr:16S rRNA (guanine(966)-N(2))-methyltransferase RsmD [Gammaproteobacteria bacterium]
MLNKLRIIGGSLRSRQITVLDESALRPTPNRIRETLFNWLRIDIIGAHCLDLFAGSGALGFEALSREAKSVTFVEKDPRIMRQLKQNSETLGTEHTQFILQDALAYLKKATDQTFDIIFLDPPYAENLLQPCLTLLHAQAFLNPHTKIYLEHDHPLSEIVFPENMSLIQHKKAGHVYYGLLACEP